MSSSSRGCSRLNAQLSPLPPITQQPHGWINHRDQRRSRHQYTQRMEKRNLKSESSNKHGWPGDGHATGPDNKSSPSSSLPLLALSFPSAEVEAQHFKSKYIEIYRTLQETKAELGQHTSHRTLATATSELTVRADLVLATCFSSADLFQMTSRARPRN